MFTLPQPKEVETIDGCPAVPLTDVLADFEDVMRAIYDPFHFDTLSPEAGLSAVITFISGILRVSTKYNMHVLRSKCISIIAHKFPSTLAGCDRVLSAQSVYEPSDIVRVIPLARETNVPEVLPWAYYLCTHIPTTKLINDSVLSWRDKALCLAGKEKLWEAQKTITHTVLFEFTRSPTCTIGCTSRLPTMGWRDTETLRASPHPLEEYTGMAALKFCAKCQAQMETQHRTGREKVWEMLPEIFQLGTWLDIRRDQSC
ncbi:hypothetical protein BDQ12DRAFT_688397 [Crucibulum laeve]|uniref:BTB domain-containing protein n=1 Tax=Crucibulum laeve TaxID=68775 RepID=A0A5C3LRH9_9AGAR|nr:hypothetical protein BDQ12DRAFT_688397 [Crucibulum laeve]